MKVTVVLIKVGALANVLKGLEKRTVRAGNRTTKTTELLRSARILRGVLNP